MQAEARAYRAAAPDRRCAMKYVALIGLRRRRRGRAGNLTAAQWHAPARACWRSTLRYGLTVLPWLLAALFTWRYWYWKRIALLYDQIAAAEQSHRQRLGAALWEKDRALERRPQQRKRAHR
jgi:hypothetical protein